MAAAADKEKDQDQQLPPLVDGEMGTILSIKVMDKKTRPPTNYTEGALIADMTDAGKFLEESDYRKILKQTSGLGTSATRAAIIEKLKKSGLLAVEGKYIVSTKKGRDLIKYLPKQLYDVATTARWEADLDVVATKGGGAAFESRIADEVINMVAILKTHERMTRSETPVPLSNKKEHSPMSETRASKPTDKMVEFATKIAKALNQPLPEEVSADFEACKKFIDDNKAAASRPSEKQLKYAESIATKKGVQIPDEVKADAREISKWIDENK